MNERLRVSITIIIWLAVACGFVTLGISGFNRITQQELDSSLAQTIADDANNSVMADVVPEDVGLNSRKLQRLDSLVNDYIATGAMPGAVVGIVRHGTLAYSKAYGHREVVGDSVKMTLNTCFDLASLTKPIATATAIMQLVERGCIRLNDCVALYMPDFESWHDDSGAVQSDIRIVDLMTHASGLPPYISMERLAKEYPNSAKIEREELIDYITHCERLCEPRTECRYSCLNYIALANIVERVSGKSLAEYATENIFEPLGMRSTRFLPDGNYLVECAPTTLDEQGTMLRGRVHDPLARNIMAGVSGNAGLFSTLNDVAMFAMMMLNGGSMGGVEVLSPRSVEAMFSVPVMLPEWERTLAWERMANYSGVCGDLLSSAAVGHTGATGTSLVIDRELDVAIIILTNRVHASSAKTFNDLRSKLATIVASAIE